MKHLKVTCLVGGQRHGPSSYITRDSVGSGWRGRFIDMQAPALRSSLFADKKGALGSPLSFSVVLLSFPFSSLVLGLGFLFWDWRSPTHLAPPRNILVYIWRFWFWVLGCGRVKAGCFSWCVLVWVVSAVCARVAVAPIAIMTHG